MNNEKIAEKALDVLKKYEIFPDGRVSLEQLGDIGKIKESEMIEVTSINEIFEVGGDDISLPDDLEGEFLEGNNSEGPLSDIRDFSEIYDQSRSLCPIEDVCAWYAPIHFFGYDWGIYIRESCIKTEFLLLNRFIDRRKIVNKINLRKQLYQAAFLVPYLHEQFHHKVESLCFKALLTSGKNVYGNYKYFVQGINPKDHLEEALASAEMILRQKEKIFSSRIDPHIRQVSEEIQKKVLQFFSQPQYTEGLKYLTRGLFKNGLHHLQSQIIEAQLKPKILNNKMWYVAPGMIRSMMNIHSEIYKIVPIGTKAAFPIRKTSPRLTASSTQISKALEKHYGFSPLKGRGKGSHEVLGNKGKIVTLSGNRKILPFKDIKDALKAVGGQGRLFELPKLLEGRL